VIRRALVPAYAGVAITIYGLCFVHATWRDPDWSIDPFGWPLVYVALVVIAAYAAGIPDVVRDRWQAVTASIAAVLGATLALSAAQLVVGAGLLPRFVIGGSVLIIAVWFVACCAMVRRTVATARKADRVVVLAEPDVAHDMVGELAGDPERSAVVVGAMTVEEACDLTRGGDQLIALVRATRANVLVLGHDAASAEAVVGQAATVHEQGVRIRTVPMFYEEWLGKLPVSHLERLALMFDINEVHRTLYGRFRRLFDLPLALAGCFVLVLVTPVVVIANVFGNRGPLFYSQPRVGRQGRIFQIHKFRSMAPVAGGGGPDQEVVSTTWTSVDDPRVTRFGRFLRKTHLDELPQVVNILKGELAVIGPRPEQPHYVEELSEKLPYYNLRHMVTPGLTGWAQVKAGYLAEDDDHIQKLQYEFFHLRHQRVGLDLRILLRTLRSVAGTHAPGR